MFIHIAPLQYGASCSVLYFMYKELHDDKWVSSHGLSRKNEISQVYVDSPSFAKWK